MIRKIKVLGSERKKLKGPTNKQSSNNLLLTSYKSERSDGKTQTKSYSSAPFVPVTSSLAQINCFITISSIVTVS